MLQLPKLKLVHQILLVVSIPLLSQLLFVVMLESLWQNTRIYSKQALLYKDILLQVNTVNQDILDVSQSYQSNSNQSSTSSLDLAERFDKDTDQLKSLLSKRRVKAIDSTELNRSIDEIKSILPRPVVEQSPFSSLSSQLVQSTSYTHPVDSKLEQFRKKLGDYYEKEKLAFDIESKQAKKAQETLQRILAVGLALNIVLVPCLVLYLSQRLSNRLRSLIANSERLKDGKELGPPIGGDDELAQLETVFLDMADSLIIAKKKEKQFVTMVSHDLRTPLNSVLATLNTIAEGNYGSLSEKGMSNLKNSEQSIERVVKLTDALLEMDRLALGNAALTLRAVSLQKVIERSIAEIRGFADYKDILIEHEPNEYKVLIDEERIIQVFVNLLSNAIKFSPDNSFVKIEVRKIGAGIIEVNILDQGCGVPEEYRQQIFEPFEQVKEDDRNNLNGAGVGLSICKGIIEEHGGKIGVKSNGGNGSNFWFQLRRI